MEVVPVIPDVIVIVGVVRYPVPAFEITKAVITPEPIVGTIIVPLPPPPPITICVFAAT